MKLTVAGKIRSAQDVHAILKSNVDFVTIGRDVIGFPQAFDGNAIFFMEAPKGITTL